MPGKKPHPEKMPADVTEYHCSAFYRYNKLTRQQEYCIRLETSKVFSALSYRLTVKAEKKKKELNLYVLGMIPDQTYRPEIKPAIADTMFNDLYGDYRINVIRQDGSINSAVFHFNIFKREILLSGVADSEDGKVQFCQFHTAEDLNTFS